MDKKASLLIYATAILFMVTMGAAEAGTNDIEAVLSDSAGASAFQVQNSATTPLVSILSNGNVGIGTTTPTIRLHVIGSATVSANLGIGTTTAAANLHVQGTGTVIGGSLGIGTTTPATALHVIGTVTATAFEGSIASRLAVRKGADESVTSSITLQDDDELSLTLQANTNYIIEGSIHAFSINTVPEIKIAFVIPSGAMDIGLIAGRGTTLSRAQLLETSGTASDVIPISANNTTVIQVMGTVSIGGTAGTLKLQWAQNTSDANAVTVKVGSYLKAIKL